MRCRSAAPCLRDHTGGKPPEATRGGLVNQAAHEVIQDRVGKPIPTMITPIQPRPKALLELVDAATHTHGCLLSSEIGWHEAGKLLHRKASHDGTLSATIEPKTTERPTQAEDGLGRDRS